MQRYLQILLLSLCCWLVAEAQLGEQSSGMWHVRNHSERADTPDEIYQLQQDHTGLIWAGTRNGLYRFDGYEWRNYKSHSGDGTRLKSNDVTHIYMSSAGNLWCLIDYHAVLFDLKRYQFVDVLADYNRQTGQELTITKIRTLSNGSTWFITKEGILLTTPDDTADSIVCVIEAVGNDDIKVATDSTGQTQITTPHGFYTYVDGKLKRLADEPPASSMSKQPDDQTPSLSAPQASTFPVPDNTYRFTDRKGNVWYFHEGQLIQLSKPLTNYQRYPLPQTGLIRAALRDSAGRVWLSDRTNSYLMLFSPQRQLLGFLDADGHLDPAPRPFSSPVFCLLQDRSGSYWVGTRNSGLYRIREESEGQFHVDHFSKDNSTLNDNKIYDIKEDLHGRLWIGTDQGGPNCIPQPQDDQPLFIHADNELKGYLPTFCRKNYVVLPTHDNHLLVGTAEGLYVAEISGTNLKDIVFKEHQREPLREHSLGSSNIGSMTETGDHRLFVGTQGGGINEIVSSDLTAVQLDFRHYDVTKGMPTDLPRALFTAKNGSLWVVGKKQLTEVSMSSDGQVVVNSYLGRTNLTFTNMAPVQLSDGQWLLGVEDGAIVVTLDELKQNVYVPPIVITDVVIEGENVNYVPQAVDTVVLAPGQRNVSITFAALEFDEMYTVQYAFRMDDQQPWNLIGGGGHSVSLANLDPGTYQLTLHSTNTDGQWMPNDHAVTIIVKPTFWQTGWAKLLFLFIVLFTVALVAYTLLYIRRIKRQQHQTLEAYLSLMEAQRPQTAPDEMDSPSHEVMSHPSPKLSPEDEAFMKRLMTYIEDNIGNSDASPEDMADATATSRSSLNRKVNRLVGMSPMEFLREARMRKACQLLKETLAPVYDIAYDCGFANPKYFSKFFKEAFGQTPTQYRESY